MAEINPDPQKDGTGTPPVPAPVVPPATSLDLGEGNMLTIAQALEMRTAKVGLEKEKQDLLGQVGTLTESNTKGIADLATANQSRIAAEAATTTANARTTEAEGKAANFVAPGEYQELQKKVGTQEWNTLVEKATRISTQYNVPQDKLFGLNSDQLDTFETGVKLGGGNAKNAPVLNSKGALGDTTGQTPFNSAIEKNVETLKRIREGDKTAGLLG